MKGQNTRVRYVYVDSIKRSKGIDSEPPMVEVEASGTFTSIKVSDFQEFMRDYHIGQRIKVYIETE